MARKPPKPLKPEITGYSVAISLGKRQWNRLDRLERFQDESKFVAIYDKFERSLKELGAFEIDFCGHFGSYIFYRVEKAEEIEKVAKEIETWLCSPEKIETEVAALKRR